MDIYCPACGEWQTNQNLPELWPEPTEEQWRCPNCGTAFRFGFYPLAEDPPVPAGG